MPTHDVGHLVAVCRSNALDGTDAAFRLSREQPAAALFPLVSVINSSEAGRVILFSHGRFLMARAAEDMLAGTDLTRCLVPPEAYLEDQPLKSWSVTLVRQPCLRELQLMADTAALGDARQLFPDRDLRTSVLIAANGEPSAACACAGRFAVNTPDFGEKKAWMDLAVLLDRNPHDKLAKEAHLAVAEEKLEAGGHPPGRASRDRLEYDAAELLGDSLAAEVLMELESVLWKKVPASAAPVGK
jgi:hypothetical protein